MTDSVEPRLKHLPITFFAIVMGLMGLSLAFHAATPFFKPAGTLAGVVLWVGIAAAVVIALAYLAKAVRHPGMVA